MFDILIFLIKTNMLIFSMAHKKKNYQPHSRVNKGSTDERQIINADVNVSTEFKSLSFASSFFYFTDDETEPRGKLNQAPTPSEWRGQHSNPHDFKQRFLPSYKGAKGKWKS